MQPPPRCYSRASVRRPVGIAMLLIATAACGSPADPPVAPGVGSLEFAVSTVGPDSDADGYTYSLDGGTPQAIGPNAAVLLNGLAAGPHTLAVAGVAANCAAPDANRSVTVRAAETARVAVAVTCTALPVTHPTGVIAATRPLAGAPYGVAVSRAGVVYAALIGSNTLIKGDLATMSFGGLVTVGSTPPHVAMSPDDATVYATLQTGRGVAAVDVASNTLVGTVPLASDGFNLIVSPRGDRVYATTAAGTVYVIDARSRAVLTTVQVGPAANGLAFSPDGRVLYVSSRDAGTVSAINTETNAVIRTYSIGGQPQRLAVAPDGAEFYVANEVNGLDVVTVGTGAVASFAFGTAGYGLGLTPDGRQLYVLLADRGEVRVLDRVTRAVVRTLAVGGRPRNVAFDAAGRTAVIATEDAVVFVR